MQCSTWGFVAARWSTGPQLLHLCTGYISLFFVIGFFIHSFIVSVFAFSLFVFLIFVSLFASVIGGVDCPDGKCDGEKSCAEKFGATYEILVDEPPKKHDGEVTLKVSYESVCPAGSATFTAKVMEPHTSSCRMNIIWHNNNNNNTIFC